MAYLQAPLSKQDKHRSGSESKPGEQHRGKSAGPDAAQGVQGGNLSPDAVDGLVLPVHFRQLPLFKPGKLDEFDGLEDIPFHLIDLCVLRHHGLNLPIHVLHNQAHREIGYGQIQKLKSPQGRVEKAENEEDNCRNHYAHVVLAHLGHIEIDIPHRLLAGIGKELQGVLPVKIGFLLIHQPLHDLQGYLIAFFPHIFNGEVIV